ncbi:uncharacterized protein LOC129221935 [Uloborus diversus]|uniref:uncharacterized protein LOC129221935 n=1 Tax=Uloborus diversus TaxID=327109 RepID=UPI0024095BED|nr:uncharacterized protein LOC129221935 [Uloborus diversus]
MAAGGRDIQVFSSDDEIIHPVEKRNRKRKAILSSEEDDEDSNFEVKPRRAARPLNCESDEDDSVNLFNNESENHLTEGRMCSENHESSTSTNDMSDNEQADKCAICLNKFWGQDIATPETCDHMFCLECLLEWAKNVNTCPIDRLRFNLILIRHHKEEKIIKRIFINNPELPRFTEFEWEFNPQTRHVSCELCGEQESDSLALLVCQECHKVYHSECLIPPVHTPMDSWLCPSCADYVQARDKFLHDVHRVLRGIKQRFRDLRSLNGGSSSYSSGSPSVRMSTQHSHRDAWNLRQRAMFTRRRVLSSSDSSEEETEHNSSHAATRLLQTNSSSAVKTRYSVLDGRRREICCSRNPTLVSSTASATANSSLYSYDSDDGLNDYSYQNDGNVLSRSGISRRQAALKRFSAPDQVSNSRLSDAGPENFDLVGSILQSQTLLHRPDVLTLKRDGSLLCSKKENGSSSPSSSSSMESIGHNQNPLQISSLFSDNTVSPYTDDVCGQQRPLNPTQNSAVKYSGTPRQNYSCSSTTSSVERSPSYDTNISTKSAHGGHDNEQYNNENSSPMAHKNFCSSSTPEVKKTISPNLKDSAKSQHSEEEVDIYSDIESVGEEEGEVNEREPMKISYKCEELSLTNAGDGSDSSDNELVIDESTPVEDENEGHKAHLSTLNSKNNLSENKFSIAQSDESNVSSTALSDQDQQITDNSHQSPSCSYVGGGCDTKHRIVDKMSEHNILNKEVVSNSEKNTHRDHNAQNSDIDIQQDENSEDTAGNVYSASSSPKQLIQDFRTVSLETYSNASEEKEENLKNGILNGNESTLDSLSQPEGNEKYTTESNSLLSCESDVQNNEISESEDVQNMDVSEPEEIENEVTSEPEDTQNADESEPEDARDADVSESEDILNADASGPEDTQNAEMSESEDTQNSTRNDSEYPQNDTEGSEPEDTHNVNTSEPEDVQNANESEPEDIQDESESEVVQNASISEPEDAQNIGSEPEDAHNENTSNLENNLSNETNERQVLNNTNDVANEPQVTNVETLSREVNPSECSKKSANTSSEFNDENVHAPEEKLKDTKNTDLVDICNDISMKSDGLDEDDLENAGTPCLDENFEGQIENSPICNENSGSLCESEDQKNNEHIYESGMLSVVQDTGPTKETFKSAQIAHKESLNAEKERLEPDDDLGVEDISEAGSEDLDNEFPDEHENMESHDSVFNEPKRERTHAYHKSHTSYEDEHDDKRNRLTSSDRYPSTSHSNHSLEDHEEGEIIEERPPRRSDKKRSSKVVRYREQSEEYRERTPKISISDLPRIPKIKRDREKNNVPEEIPIESKRTSVLGRVDLGGDISWKRLSKHTRERSYRDGRPKDERLLFRERESSRKNDKKNNDNEWRNGSKNRDSERRRDDKKSENEKPKCEHISRSRKSEKSKEKTMDWNYSEREKRKSHKDKHSKDKHKEKKEKHEKKHSKSEDKYEREKTKDDSRYERELRYEKEEHFERIVYEKGKFKEKEHKNKHKDRKSDGKSNKEHSREKHKHAHGNEYFSEGKREREVRKIDDKLKIVVEQKERKDKSSKHKDKKEAKHEKKLIHHHEHRKKEIERSPYTELTSIESKEIFAKGDSIIINVNFNRACSPKEPVDNSGSSIKDWKSISDEFDVEDQLSVDESKSKLLSEKGKNSLDASVSKRPATPPERNTQVMSVSESYWQGGEDSDVNNSPLSEKSAEEGVAAEEDNETVESVDVYEAENFSNSSTSVEVLETQVSPKDGVDETEEVSECPDKNSDKPFTKENDNFSAKRRSPRSPSPPSPADNDSYDPCEPTRSPSPPPMPPAPPLPAAAPKPPPSPELPPLPPDPEPIDTIREDPRSHKQCSSSDFISSSTVVPSSSQPTTVLSQTSIANSLSMPNMLLPPPTFLTHASSTTNTLPTISPLIPPRNFGFQVNNHGALLFPPNHVQQNIPNSFVPTQMHAGTSLPPPPNPPSLPHMGSVPPPPPPPSAMALISQVRHPQINVQPTLPPSSLLQSITLGHTVNMAQMQLTQLHHLTPSLHSSISNHQSSMIMPAVSQPGSLPVSIQQTQQGARIVIAQNQIPNHTANVQNQNNNNSQIHPVNSLSLHPQTISNNLQQKSDKVSKHSPPNEKTEVVDMEVDSPYSPGDSPSMDSVGDYSPTSSPLPSSPKTKDVFDSLLPLDQWTFEKQTQDGRTEKSKRSGSKHDTPSKRMKREHKESGKVRHSIRLQVSDKMKNSRKEQKLSEKKETLMKLDDSQLKILDELPSSAVEMQVKEKYLKKLNRQERVVEEVKLALKPYYKSRDVSKEEYKDILRKSVPKICHNKSGEINPVKVKSLVESYVKKVKHSRKKAEKRKSSKFS